MTAPHPTETRLLLQAFEMARERGVDDWKVMRIAVLKNRMLQLSRGAFDEKKLGFPNFTAFVSSLSDLVEVAPPDVHLRAAPPSPQPKPMALEEHHTFRIRPDLWRSIMDFSGGTRYRWDPTSGQAIPTTAETDAYLMPTLTADEFNTWRAEFAASTDSNPAVVRWHQRGLGTRDLPHSMQGQWNGFVRNKVENRLARWFESVKIAPPEILVEHAKPQPKDSDSLHAMRQFVSACVAAMTLEELRALQVPAEAAFRVWSSKQR